jgi:GTP-binding protein EngB required for normal cell division
MVADVWDSDDPIDHKIGRDDIWRIQNDVRRYDQYQLQATEARNILVLGRTRVGKSTFVRMLKDFAHAPPTATLYAETQDATYKTFCINPQSVKGSLTTKYSINIVDTPGLFEVRRVSEGKGRDNRFIRQCINKCLENEIARVHCVLIFLTVQGGINVQDVESIETFLTDFGSKDIRTCLVITHAEDFSQERMNKVVKELNEYPRACKLLKEHQVEILFSGSVDPEKYTVEQDLARAYKKVYKLREKILQTIFEAPSEGAKLIDLPVVPRAQDEALKLARTCRDFLSGMLQGKLDTSLATVKLQLEAHRANMAELSQSMRLVRISPALLSIAQGIDLLLRDVAERFDYETAAKLSGPFTSHLPMKPTDRPSASSSSASSSA